MVWAFFSGGKLFHLGELDRLVAGGVGRERGFGGGSFVLLYLVKNTLLTSNLDLVGLLLVSCF